MGGASKSAYTDDLEIISGATHISDRLRNIAELRNDGILTEEEYRKKKGELYISRKTFYITYSDFA